MNNKIKVGKMFTMLRKWIKQSFCSHIFHEIYREKVDEETHYDGNYTVHELEKYEVRELCRKCNLIETGYEYLNKQNK